MGTNRFNILLLLLIKTLSSTNITYSLCSIFEVSGCIGADGFVPRQLLIGSFYTAVQIPSVLWGSEKLPVATNTSTK
jgi:hypothetical protein